MNIRTAMSRLVQIERNLTIAEPVAATIKRAYMLPPPTSRALTDFPCFINNARLEPLTLYDSALLRRLYVVNLQLFVKDANTDRACDIALAFEEQLIRALAANVMLGGAITNIGRLSGELTLLEWAGQGYPGLNYFVELNLAEAQVMAAGAA